MLALEMLAGLASGTFYSLTMTFVLTSLPKRLIIFGIAPTRGHYFSRATWQRRCKAGMPTIFPGAGFFGTAALVTPLMMLCVYFGVPRRNPVLPAPSWRGFAYFSLSLGLLYGASIKASVWTGSIRP